MRWLVVIFWLFATPLLAQTTDEEAPAALVADRIELTADDLLVASGNVEILQGDTRMTAAEVRYDGATDTLRITGPIRIQDGPDVLILAEQAEMSQGLQDGILRSARLVLDQQLQLAAAQMQRVDGRYTQLWKVGATSCHVCGTGPPLWQIRARRIVHDQEEQQLYFDNMRFEVYGIPILYLPRLRLPDPNLDRATGFLLPSIRTTSRLGWGIKAPYFVKLGDHADVTITPYLSPRTRTVELTFRRAFVNGDIEADVNLTDDDLIDDGRWAILAEGAFDLPRDFKLTFDVQMVSDDGYLLDYGYGSQDRLPTGIEITRTDRDENTSAALISYQTLRDGEDAKTLPSITFDADYTRRLFPEVLGGEVQLTGALQSYYRESSAITDADGDGLADGLDLGRASAAASWTRDWIVGPGFVFGAAVEGAVDFYSINEDPSFDSAVTRTRQGAAVSLRWPLIHRGGGSGGVTHVLEPAVQLAWVDTSGGDVPNEDSTRVEFDEGNLFALDRSPGANLTEVGRRADFGLTWSRFGADGWDSSLTVGRVMRASGGDGFTDTSGLSGDRSDWLISGTLATPGAFDLIGRLTFADDFTVSKNEIRADWTGDRVRMGSAYAYLRADVDEDRPIAVSELTLDAAYDFNDTVTGEVDWRYDFNTGQTAFAEVGLTFVNECVEVGVSVSRRFTSSATVSPSTDFGLVIGLRGFGTGSADRQIRKSCR